ncbi:hypothetical protein ACJ41O_001315 [Fusarium nematophilum]
MRRFLLRFKHKYNALPDSEEDPVWTPQIAEPSNRNENQPDSEPEDNKEQLESLDFVLVGPPQAPPVIPQDSNERVERARDEILIQIASYLSPIDRACLAVVNRHVHKVLNGVPYLDHETRWRLLRRLERRGAWMSEILCRECCMFHRPREIRASSAKDATRPCVLKKNRFGNRQYTSYYLASDVYFDTVAAIMRCHSFKSRIYDVNLLASSRRYEHLDAKMSRDISARICNGRLLLKTEIILVLGKNKDDWARNSHKLTTLMAHHGNHGIVCGDHYWSNIWYTTFERGHSRYAFKAAPLDRPLQECLWTHEKPCRANCEAGPKLEVHMSRVWSCSRCDTDYKLSTAKLEGARGNAAILTSWKDLGTGKNPGEGVWLQHLHGIELVHRRSGWGKIWEDFEGTKDRYVPCLSGTVVEELLG